MSQLRLPDILRIVTSRSSAPFACSDAAMWDSDALPALLAEGMLVEGPDASTVTCDGCGEGCLADVDLMDGAAGGPPRPFVVCEHRDDIWRVAVSPEALETWVFRPSAMALWLGRQLGATEVVELRPESAWRLNTALAGTQDQLLLAIAAERESLPEELIGCDAGGAGPDPVVLVPTMPTDRRSGVRYVEFADHVGALDGCLVLNVSELRAEIHRSMTEPHTPDCVAPPQLIFAPSGEIVRFRGRDVALTPLERAMMAVLVKRCGRFVEIGALARAGWGDNLDHMDAVRPVIGRLRQKLGDASVIQTQRGRHDVAGAYRLNLKQYQIAEDE